MPIDDPRPVEPPPAIVLRRVPRQARAHLRIDQLLDAAALVIAEAGVGAATTNAIAERAGASVGSLYQFFPNKQAIVTALARRYAAEFDALKDRIMSVDVAHQPFPRMIRGIVAPMAAFFDANPAYPRVFAATMESDLPSGDAEASLHAAVIARVDAMLERRFPALSADRRHVVASAQVHTVHAIMIASSRCDAPVREHLREELIRMLVAALEGLELEG